MPSSPAGRLTVRGRPRTPSATVRGQLSENNPFKIRDLANFCSWHDACSDLSVGRLLNRKIRTPYQLKENSHECSDRVKNHCAHCRSGNEQFDRGRIVPCLRRRIAAAVSRYRIRSCVAAIGATGDVIVFVARRPRGGEAQRAPIWCGSDEASSVESFDFIARDYGEHEGHLR